MKLAPLFRLLDPDTNWRSFATIQHFLSGLILMQLFHWGRLSLAAAFWWTLYTAVVYEIAQTDIAYNIKDQNGERYAGRPGFGFSLMDIAASLLGAGLWLLGRNL